MEIEGINTAQRNVVFRLLQSLTVAVRTLHVEELAELLSFDFQASSSGRISRLKEDWRGSCTFDVFPLDYHRP